MNIFKTTFLYGKSFEARNSAGVYSLRVYTGGFAGVIAATKRASKEAESFIESSEYSNFRVLESKRVWFPFSCVDFLVGFYDETNHKQAGQGKSGLVGIPPFLSPACLPSHE